MKKYVVSALALFFIASLCKAQTPTLYGMTQNGGDSSAGTIFRFDVTGGIDTVLHSFGADSDGTNPTGSLLLASNGLLYGVTANGGTYAKGVLFTYNIGTGAYNVIHNFGDGIDAQTPHGTLIEASNGVLYGMSESGGIYSSGTIFSYNRYTDSVQIIYNLGALYDGELPYGSLLNLDDSLLYGLTLRGGGAGGSGALFDYNTIENTDTVLYSFGANDTDSQNPYGSVIQANNGWLYGMSYYGGKNNTGSIFGFYYSDTLYTDTLLYSFGTGTDGQNPSGSLLSTGGNLVYATTKNGGSNGLGSLISFNITSEAETVLHSFSGGADGAQPYGSLLLASNQLLYGMTSAGGTNSKGTIFSFNISNGTETAVYSFGSGTDGATPQGDLIEVDGTPAITGVQKLSASTGLSVFPNPSTGQFAVNVSGNQSAYPIAVYDVLGNKMYQSVLSNGQNTINLTNQPEGMYFVNVKTDTGVVTTKMVVAK